MPHYFSRRDFMKTAAVFSAFGVAPQFLTRTAEAAARSIAGFKDDRVLVVVQFGGGNDGLNTLVPFGDQVARGNATDAGSYEPTAYRATLQEGQAQGEMIDWPWTDVTLDDFVANPDSSFRVATLTAEQAKALSPTPEGGLFSVGVMGPDRVPDQISLRPLLPEEPS